MEISADFIGLLVLIGMYIIKWIQNNTNICKTIQQNKEKIEKLEQMIKVSNENNLMLKKIHNNQPSPAGTPQVLFDNDVFKEFKERQLRGINRTNEIMSLIKIDEEMKEKQTT